MLGFRSRLAPFASAQLSSRPQLRISRSARASRLLRRLQPASGRPSLASGLAPLRLLPTLWQLPSNWPSTHGLRRVSASSPPGSACANPAATGLPAGLHPFGLRLASGANSPAVNPRLSISGLRLRSTFALGANLRCRPVLRLRLLGSASACPPAVSGCLNRSRRARAPRPILGSPTESPSSSRCWGTRPAAVVVSLWTRVHLPTLRPRREPDLHASAAWLAPPSWELSACACRPC
jgi:hypothetical protein